MSEGELQKAKIAFLDRRVDDLACMEPCARLDSGACLDAMSQNLSFSAAWKFLHNLSRIYVWLNENI